MLQLLFGAIMQRVIVSVSVYAAFAVVAFVVIAVAGYVQVVVVVTMVLCGILFQCDFKLLLLLQLF